MKFLPEYSCTDKEGNYYRIDLMITDGKEFVAMEFKYVMAQGVIVIPGNDNYILKNHAAIAIRRHQCVKDISRLEAYKMISDLKCICGYFLLISNLKYFWNGSDNTKVGKQFDIKEGFNLENGMHSFDGNYRVAQTHPAISLENDYTIHYGDYLVNDKELKEDKKIFKYLLVKI